jgi:murein DD-endopeptidase MepM/ murein hydrolase activator NlpD
MPVLHGNSRNIFVFVAIICLSYYTWPGYTIKQQEVIPEEYGIGGSILYEVDILGDDDENFLFINASLESIALENQSFPKPRTLLYDSHTVRSGENVSQLAMIFGLNQDTIISVNRITNSRLLQIGRVLRIPNQDGILHTTRSGETLSSIAARYNADQEAIKKANELFSDRVTVGRDLFIPGARLDFISLREINGDLFIWPVAGVITSPYGYRRDPFNPNRRQFHSGIDIRASTGTPIRAAMAGRVSQVGFDRVLGNFVIINHHSGYRTLYAHMSAIRTRAGAYVAVGERIGYVGSTGLSTGPHLHFTVYRNGVTVNPRTLMR